MSLITVEYLQDELDEGASNENGLLTKAINRATASINTWASRRYDPFEDFDITNNIPLAPDEIIAVCVEVAKAYYFLSLGEVSRNGEEQAYWKTILDAHKTDLYKLEITPKWETQPIALDSNDSMLIGTQTASARFPRIIPQNAYIISGASAVWSKNSHWVITKGQSFDDEHPDAWYLRGLDNTIEGILYYMRSYRKDGKDYAIYQTMD